MSHQRNALRRFWWPHDICWLGLHILRLIHRYMLQQNLWNILFPFWSLELQAAAPVFHPKGLWSPPPVPLSSVCVSAPAYWHVSGSVAFSVFHSGVQQPKVEQNAALQPSAHAYSSAIQIFCLSYCVLIWYTVHLFAEVLLLLLSHVFLMHAAWTSVFHSLSGAFALCLVTDELWPFHQTAALSQRQFGFLQCQIVEQQMLSASGIQHLTQEWTPGGRMCGLFHFCMAQTQTCFVAPVADSKLHL